MKTGKRGAAALIAAVMVLALALSGCSAQKTTAGFAGGSGTADDPYQIATAEQLERVRNELTASYVLTADIDLVGIENWTSIGDVKLSATDPETGEVDFSTAFSGTFDGGGYTISNLNCTAADDSIAAGLFGCMTGTVTNLTMENAVVIGSETNMAIGGVMGYGMGTVTDITLKGDNTITGINCVGGIVGGNQGRVDGCTVENADIVVIGDNDFTGGLIQCDIAECGGLVVGGSFMGTVDYCTANGTVTATGNEPVGLGGIAGCIQCAPSITGNTVTVRINAGNGHAIGGLCGYAGMGDDGDGTIDPPCSITDCTVNVTVNANGATHVGGLVGTGLYYYGMEDRFTVENCSVTGAINGAVTPGTVAGRAVGSEIISCKTNVKIDGKQSESQIGTTDCMYQGGDQYSDGSSNV